MWTHHFIVENIETFKKTNKHTTSSTQGKVPFTGATAKFNPQGSWDDVGDEPVMAVAKKTISGTASA